jgi:hypothetical protein
VVTVVSSHEGEHEQPTTYDQREYIEREHDQT